MTAGAAAQAGIAGAPAVAIPVLRVTLAGTRPALSLAATADWFARISDGQWSPRPLELAPVALPRPVAWYAPSGGIGPPPRNAQALVADALQAWIAAAGPARLDGPAQVVAIVPPGLRAHTWHLRNGGVYLGGGRTCRRYALLPDDASPWTAAHELGHLFLDLPDLGPASGQLGACLMAPGPTAESAPEPPPPCAPLRVRLGWSTAAPIARTTRVADLPPGGCAGWAAPGGQLIVERTGPRCLVIHLDRPGAPQHPRRVATLSLTDGDDERPLLAVLAPFTRLHR